jgi:hypothetical protein
MSYYSNPHGHQCPWYPYNELFGPSNIQWCEETMCQWVSEPINTYSNLSYILISLILFAFVLKKKNSDLNMMPKLLLGIGIASSIYHASNNYMGQILDFLFIFLFLFWPLTLNMKRLGKISEKNQYYFYGAITSAFLIVMHIMYLTFIPFQFLAAVAGALLCLSEWKCSKIEGNNDRYAYFITALLVIAVGEVFSFLDLKRVICTPSNHLFQGHALWHIISAIGLGFLILHMYKNIPDDKPSDHADDYEDEHDDSSFSKNIVSNMEEEDDIEYYDEEIEEDTPEEHESTIQENVLEVVQDSSEFIVAEQQENIELNQEVSEEEDQLELSFETQTHDDPIIDTYSDPEDSEEVEDDQSQLEDKKT